MALVLALGVAGCSRPAGRTDVPDPSIPATTSAESSAASSPDSRAVDPDGTQDPGAPIVESGPLSSVEASALERELEAIERELEGLDMPSDSDFEDLEGSLD